MAKRAKWTRLALHDVTETLAYIGLENPVAAASVAQQLEAAVELLEEWPQVGRNGRYAGTKEWAVKGLSYVIWYRITPGDRIEILRVLHTSRQWPEKP